MFATHQPTILYDLARERQRELYRQAQQERLCREMQPDRPSLTLFTALLHLLHRPQNQPKSAMLTPISAG